jgi:hypothetical protein
MDCFSTHFRAPVIYQLMGPPSVKGDIVPLFYFNYHTNKNDMGDEYVTKLLVEKLIADGSNRSRATRVPIMDGMIWALRR